MKKAGFVVWLFLLPWLLSGQRLAGVGKLVQGGLADGEKLLDAYLLPLNRAMISGPSNYTFNGLLPEDGHRFWLALQAVRVNIPDADRRFDVTDLNLESVEPENPANSITPTAFGDSSTIRLVSKYGIGNLRYFSFSTQPGTEKSAWMIPFLGAGYQTPDLGISLKLIPPVRLPETDLQVWMAGIGLRQNVKSILHFLDFVPVEMYLSAGAFTFRGNAPLRVEPEDVELTLPITDDRKGPYDNQKLKTGFNGFYGELMAARRFGAITVYASAGYKGGAASLDILGTYPVYVRTAGSFAAIRAKDVTDPIATTSVYSHLKLDAGLRLSFGHFFVQAGYALSPYGGIAVGVGYGGNEGMKK